MFDYLPDMLLLFLPRQRLEAECGKVEEKVQLKVNQDEFYCVSFLESAIALNIPIYYRARTSRR